MSYVTGLPVSFASQPSEQMENFSTITPPLQTTSTMPNVPISPVHMVRIKKILKSFQIIFC